MSTVRAVLIHPDGRTEAVQLASPHGPVGIAYDAIKAAIGAADAEERWASEGLYLWVTADHRSPLALNMVASRVAAKTAGAGTVHGPALLVRDQGTPFSWDLHDVTDADLEAVL